jgi:hypothetical protein
MKKYSQAERENIKILIATPESVQAEIKKTLEENGLRNYQAVTSEIFVDLWCRYQSKSGQFPVLDSFEDNGSESPSNANIYIARFCRDTRLCELPAKHDYFREIQVGAALTDVRVDSLWENGEVITDNTGDNISEKNVNYSEMTALYWIWKNVLSGHLKAESAEYIGMCHYRRQLALLPEDIRSLAGRGVDVVLPFPMPYEPNISVHQKRYISDSDWNAVKQAVSELQPEYYSAMDGIFGQRYLYNYNVIVARKEVLRDYCEWLFPILARVEETSTPKGSERADRYIGYIAENLETLYFMKNNDKLRIAHVGCLFRV